MKKAPANSSEQIQPYFNTHASTILFKGDVHDFLQDVPDKAINLVITSPPYNLGKDYESRVEVEKYLQQQSTIIKELKRVLKDDGSICWQVGNFIENGEVFPLDILYYPIFKEHGFFLRNRIVWRFGHGLHASKRFSGRYETILWFSKSKNYTFNLDAVRVPSKYPGKKYYKGEKKGQLSGNSLGKNPSDFWEITTHDWDEEIWDIPNVKAHHPEKTIHPCQFPVELVERCLFALTNEGDTVLDPYTGTGSTIIAAIKNNRKGVGCEKDIKYYRLAHKRITEFISGKLKLRPFGKPVYNPSNEAVAQIPDKWIKDKKTIYYVEKKK